jgi:hypothetical protein
MWPLRTVLGLAAVAAFCVGIITTYNSSVAPTSRVGPGWFQAMSLYGGSAMLLVGVVLSIATVQVGAGGDAPTEPRGLLLGRNTLRAGALLLAVGVLWPVLAWTHLVPMLFPLVSIKLPPILVAIGAVLLWRSAGALERDAPRSRTILTLGEATIGTGVALFFLGRFLFSVLSSFDRQGLGFFGFIMGMDCPAAGLALFVVGALIRIAEARRGRGAEDEFHQDQGPEGRQELMARG